MQEGRGEQERKGGMGKRGREGEGMGVRGGRERGGGRECVKVPGRQKRG